MTRVDPLRPIATALAALVLAVCLSVAALADDLADAQRRGVALLRAGKEAEALAQLEKALDLAEARYGVDSPATAGDLNNLAEANRIAGRLDVAEALYRRAIAIDAGKGGDPIGLATSLNNLALVQRAGGRNDEAEKLYLQALPLLEQELGPTHPDIAKALNNLAVLYRVRGEPEKARPLQRLALAIAESSLGSAHATTAALRANLALLDGKAVEPAAGPATKKGGAAPIPRFRPRPVVAAVAAPADAARLPAAASRPPAGGTLLHLGSIKDGGALDREWARLLQRHPGLADLQRVPPQRVEVAGKGTFWRVLATAPSPDVADATCARLEAAGDACRVLRR